MIDRRLTDGKHRRADSSAHGNSLDRTGHGTEGAGPTFGPFPPTRLTHAAISIHDAPSYTNTKPNSGPHAGIRTGEVIGWRCWWVFEEQQRIANFYPNVVPTWWDPNDVPVAGTVKTEIKSVLRLCSIAHKHLWEPGATETGDVDQWIPCGFYDVVPGGVYAWRSHQDCLARVTAMCVSRSLRTMQWNSAVSVAWGTIKMWGEVVTHRGGWRATHAKVSSIENSMDFDGRCISNLAELRNIYGVTGMSDYIGDPWDE